MTLTFHLPAPRQASVARLQPVLGSIRVAACWIGILGLVACAAPEHFQKPEMPVPAAFKASSLWKTANAQVPAVPDAWWQLFNDPVLNDLQTQVVVGNETLKSNAAQLAAARAALGSSRASQLPVVGVSAGINHGVNTGGTVPTTANSLAVNASWELDLWGRLAGGVESAQARLQASEADLAAARLSVQAALTQTYLSMRHAESQAALLERSVVAYQRSLELTQNRYNAGIVSALDVAQATTQLRSTQVQLIDSNSSRAQLENALATLLGKPAAAVDVARTARLPAAPPIPVQLPSQLLERRPDIAAAAARAAAANAQVGVAQTAFFPQISLSANAGFRGPEIVELINTPNLFWSLGTSVLLGLFDGGARQATTDSAKAALEQSAANYRQTVLTALQEVEDNLVATSSLQEESVLQSDALQAARRSLEISNNQYKAGTVSYLNVVSAQTTELAAERTALEIQNRRLAATAQLLKNLAGRWKAGD